MQGLDDPTTLHEPAFVPNIKALCSESQQTYWLPLAKIGGGGLLRANESAMGQR